MTETNVFRLNVPHRVEPEIKPEPPEAIAPERLRLTKKGNRPLPCGRISKWKKPLAGDAVRRKR